MVLGLLSFVFGLWSAIIVFMKKNHCPQASFPEVQIVEASAGSGKTYALAKRFVSLLINPRLRLEEIPLSNILAITFTLKATREMRERILEFLKKIALDKFQNEQEAEDILSYLSVERELAREKAYRVLEYLMQNYNFFQVQNIDSFINVILSGCASELKLSANFRIKENYREFLTFSLDKLIDRASRDKVTAKIFSNFLRQYLYIENKYSWYPKNDVLDIIETLYVQSNIYGANFKKFDIEPRQIIKQKKDIVKMLQKLNNNCPQGLSKVFIKSLDRFLQRDRSSFDLQELSSKAFQKDALPMNKGCIVPLDLQKLWQNIRKNIVSLSKKEALSLFNCYIDIFDIVYADFKDSARENDVVFLGELNRQARVLFEEVQLGVPELYYRLASRFRHYLIDEFQDTSILQWKNLLLMIEEALSTGGSLFYVGDKKQAIYRFRGGEVKLFDEIKQEFAAFNVKDEFHLAINYRSQQEIVKFNNKVFSAENLRSFIDAQQPRDADAERRFTDREIEEIVAVFRNSHQQSRPNKNKGYVQVEALECVDIDQRNDLIRERLIELIGQLRSRFRLKSIAVLCRSNKEIELVTGWLTQASIEVESERTLNIKNNQLVKELVSFLRFLKSPIDNIAFAAFILGDIFSNSSGITQLEVEEFLFAGKQKEKPMNPVYLYREFRKQYPEIWAQYLGDFFKNVGFVPLYELLINILDRFKVFENFKGNQGFFVRLLELVKEQEEENSSVDAFLDYLENAPVAKLYVNFSDENAVKVMTIHKAKGLGFAVVLIPFLDFDLQNVGARGNRARASYVVYKKGTDSEFGLLRLDSKYIKFSQMIRQIYKKEYLKSFIDELNVIYVSFTRAENELYVFIPDGRNRMNNAARFLIPEDYRQLGKPAEYKEEKEPNAPTSLHIPAPKYKDWIGFLRQEFIDTGQIKKRKKIKKGQILHSILFHIGNLKGVDLDRQLKLALERVRYEYPAAEQLSACGEIVKNLLQAEMMREFFFVDQGIVYQEKEIVDKSGATRRIDRLIIKEDGVLVIDYKSGGEELAVYQAQVREYMQILKSLYPQRIIKGFLLFVEDLKVEQINEKSNNL